MINDNAWKTGDAEAEAVAAAAEAVVDDDENAPTEEALTQASLRWPRERDSSVEPQLEDLQDYMGEDYAGGACDNKYEKKSGKFLVNASPIISPVDTKVDDLSKLQEPIIYIEEEVNKTILRGAREVKDKKSMPVFGYLTIGKELILKLNELQTNQNHSFTLGKGTNEKIVNWISANPVIAGALFTILANSVTKFLVEKGLAPEAIHIRNVLKQLLSYFIGDTAASWVLFPISGANAPQRELSKEEKVKEYADALGRGAVGGKRIKSKRNKFKIFKTKNKKQQNKKTKKKQNKRTTKNKNKK
jgi:hypothetical protein